MTQTFIYWDIFYEDLNSAYETFSNLFDDINKFKTASKYVNIKKTKQDKQIDKIVGFVYANVIKFKQNDLVKHNALS